eukprot:6767082-Alexandrium_andersonii.AAC.1
MIDANARAGSVQDYTVGPYCAEEETQQGKALRELLQKARLFAPATFPQHARGAQAATWHSTKGTTHRIDYVAIPWEWKGLAVETLAPGDFD